MINKFSSVLVCLLFILLPFASAENFNFDYDNNGNILNNVDNQYEYDSLNQLSKVFDSDSNLLEEYFYDHNGQRIKKVQYFDGETEITYYLDKNLVRVVNSEGTTDTYYYYDSTGSLLVKKDSDGTKQYYHPDHLGSTTVVTDSTGDIVEETSYLPFGSVLEGGDERFTYTGKEKDDSGLMYYEARYYDPELRSFTQPDTIIPDMYDPQSLNRYSYVLNNPYKYTDPSGHIPVESGDDSSLPSWYTNLLYDTILPISYEYAEQRAIDSSLGVVTENHAYKDYLPGTGDFSDVYAVFTGETYYGSEKLSGGERVLAGVLAVLPLATYKQVTVIGKLDDITPNKLSKGEHTLSKYLSPKLGSKKANWLRNSRVLRSEINKGLPIMDKSVNQITGELTQNTGFLRAERNVLQNKGWSYSPETHFWHPPK